MTASIPASTGPAGPHFEGQVGAHYLLTMLIGSEPRGLPGTTIVRVEFQRAGEGYPLDDVIVHACHGNGSPAVLEIQVKRSATFAPSDAVFRAVVAQIAKASAGPDFWTTRHELAVAVDRTSGKVAGSYQEVLRWARQIGSAETFVDRINRPGSANEHMRKFVTTFRDNLRAAEAADDDEVVWGLLKRLQILPFDYTNSGSVSEAWDKERSASALHSDDVHYTEDFQRRLVELAIDTAASGGDLTRDRLIERLKEGAFRLSGQRRYATARKAIAEASRHALDDIDDRVGSVTLMRLDRVTAVRSALSQGGYVEIRGDAGVGKSGLLKRFAKQLAIESSILVLSPGRTPPGGWTTMRSRLGFDGSAHDLLVDLASTGGATLFVDSLDFFSDDERLTVKDLVREAAGVPGFAVIATARKDFAVEEPNWLPGDALDRLGRSAPVVIEELGTAEIHELSAAAPGLAALLSETHPARAVARNLFRLARLAGRPASDELPRTEVDMAEQWWRSADGNYDSDHRARKRVLADLAKQTLMRTEPLNVASHPEWAVDALVHSQTLRDLGEDRMAFRHDVYRDWAIANLVYSLPDTKEHLRLDRPTPATHVRGIELAARMALERGSSDSQWWQLFHEVSPEGAHGSWHRAVLLATVRSEIDIVLLQRVSDHLLACGASVLRELIRTVMAVDVRPARDFAAASMDPGLIPDDMTLPGAPSWWRLILWLLEVGESLPARAIPEVLKLYEGWCVLGEEHVTPKVLEWLHRWLTEIEKARYPDDLRNLRQPFRGELDDEQVRLLESNLRTAFLTFCHHASSLAADYVQSLLSRRRQVNSIIRSVLTSPGSLAQAAPDALSRLCDAALLPELANEEQQSHNLYNFLQATGYLFFPPSCGRGPFLGLLAHAPRVGLSLIRRIVDGRISFWTADKSEESDSVSIPFANGDRDFRFRRSYAYSRASGGNDACVTTALMAVCEWGHRRIEGGESYSRVLDDVLGASDSPAAYLLVAADLVLVHWPSTREVAVPFVASPELLCVDYDQATNEYIGGIKHRGPSTRTAQHRSLYDLLAEYAVSDRSDLRERITSLLRAAAARLGPYGEQASLVDPAFMAVHAINKLDPRSWRQSSNQAHGKAAVEYIEPEAESKHLARLSSGAADQLSAASLQIRIRLAVDDRLQSSPTLAAEAIKWARHSATGDSKDGWLIVAAAFLSVRDRADDLATQDEEWARNKFAETLQSELHPEYETSFGFSFNPVALSFAGLGHSLRRGTMQANIRLLLNCAARSDCAAAPGFHAVVSDLEAINERLSRAILRTAFVACIRLRNRRTQSEQNIRRVEQYDRQVRSVVEEEFLWVNGNGLEPVWPRFPSQEPRLRPGIRIVRDTSQSKDTVSYQIPTPNEYVDHSSVARWLASAGSLFHVTARPWLRRLAAAYADWTAVANGSALQQHESVDTTMLGDWNEAYYRLLAHCLPGMQPDEVDKFALNPIKSLPDEVFFNVTERFLRHVDTVYFGVHGLRAQEAVHIRSVLADRLMQSYEWMNWDHRSMSAEVNLQRAVAAMFMNDAYSWPGPRCNLGPDVVDRVEPLLPTLQRLAVTGPCFVVTLNVIELDPMPSHLDFVVTVAEAWLKLHPDNGEFWVDYSIGGRVCALIDVIRSKQPRLLAQGRALRDRIDRLLAALVALGVAEAASLEQEMARSSEADV